MSLWRKTATAEEINRLHGGTLPESLGIRITEIHPDRMVAEMPVDQRHLQPFGLLHGGMSVVLAETVGSLASWLALPEGQIALGVEVNANHLAPVKPGDTVRAVCRPLSVGRSLQVWDIQLFRGDGRMTCAARLTTTAREHR